MKSAFKHLLLLIFITSCYSKTKTGQLGKFSIETPSTWKVSNVSAVHGSINLDSFQFVRFEYGKNVDDLEKFLQIPTVASRGFTIYPPLTGVLKLLDKSRAYFENVNGRRVKIIRPIEPTDGVTGIYIDSVENVNGEVMRFVMSGDNLSPENEKHFIDAVRTLKFHQ